MKSRSSFLLFICCIFLVTSCSHINKIRSDSLMSKAYDFDNREGKLKYFTEAIKLGSTSAMRALGQMYAQAAEGLPQDFEKTLAWYQKAYDLGDPIAARELGHMYAGKLFSIRGWFLLNKVGVEEIDQKAFQWYERAAALGDRYGMSCIGQIYQKAGDLEKAKLWYEKSVKSGNAFNASEHLGDIYMQESNQSEYESEEMKQDALEHYINAAERGNSSAMLKTAAMYAMGVGTLKEPKFAKYWTKRAYERGCHTEAVKIWNEQELFRYDDIKDHREEEYKQMEMGAYFNRNIVKLAKEDDKAE
jgi:TPR repeat protein